MRQKDDHSLYIINIINIITGTNHLTVSIQLHLDTFLELFTNLKAFSVFKKIKKSKK